MQQMFNNNMSIAEKKQKREKAMVEYIDGVIKAVDYIFIDTCAFMSPAMPSFVNLIEKVFANNTGKKITVFKSVLNEIHNGCSDTHDFQRRVSAKSALLCIQELISYSNANGDNNSIIEYSDYYPSFYGIEQTESNTVFADPLFEHLVRTTLDNRYGKNILIITQDSNLIRSLKNSYINSEYVKNPKQLFVASLNDSPNQLLGNIIVAFPVNYRRFSDPCGEYYNKVSTSRISCLNNRTYSKNQSNVQTVSVMKHTNSCVSSNTNKNFAETSNNYPNSREVNEHQNQKSVEVTQNSKKTINHSTVCNCESKEEAQKKCSDNNKKRHYNNIDNKNSVKHNSGAAECTNKKPEICKTINTETIQTNENAESEQCGVVQNSVKKNYRGPKYNNRYKNRHNKPKTNPANSGIGETENKDRQTIADNNVISDNGFEKKNKTPANKMRKQ